MKKFLLLFFAVLTISSIQQLKAQSCFNIAAGPDIHTSCLTNCVNFKAKIPDIRSSENYKVISIPYTPYPYVTTAPAFTHPCNDNPGTSQDDKFVDIATLPFNFCFYGNIYTQYVIGTNGVITFDKSNALKGNNYVIDAAIPHLGGGNQGNGICPFPNGSNYPALSIMGLYHDMWPEIGEDYKIEARIEGSAPCRKFVMSYNHVKLFGCPDLFTTFQVVLHEGTGLIDVYVENKDFCSSTNTAAVIGIQKDGTDGSPFFSSPPGRNNFTKSISNEAWRFVPNGTTSLLSRVELYKGGIKVADGVTTDLGTGELEVDFGNICLTESSAEYVVRAFYKQCDNPAVETEGSDTMMVIKSLTPVMATDITPTSCPAATDGVITLTSPLDPTVEFSIDGINWQTSNIFTGLAQGTYTVKARIIGNPCDGEITAIVPANPAPVVNSSISQPNCPTTATGSITVTAPAPGTGVEYSIDGGTNWQASPTFNGLAAGSYTITVRINPAGCTGSATFVVTDPGPIPVSSSITDVQCNGTATGIINVTAPQGSDFEYSLDGINWQIQPNFLVAAGTYTVRVRKISTNCIYTSLTYTVNEPTAVTGSALGSKNPTCADKDGEISITAAGGVTPYSYSIDNGANYQASNVFTGLTAGTYNQIKVKDANGCILQTNPVTIVLNDTMRLELGADVDICAGSSTTLQPQTNDLTDLFTWTPSAGLSSTVVKNPDASPADTTKYYLTARWGLCERKDSIIVNVKHRPTVYAGKDTAICPGTSALLHAVVISPSGTVNYAWTPTTGLDDPTVPVTAANPDTTTEYTLTVTDNFSCSFTVSDIIRVKVNPPVVAFAGNDTNAILNRPHQLQATGGLTYTWTPAAPLNNPFISNPLATLKVDTYFTVTAKDDIGCADTDDIFIKVYEGPNYYLPNAFTPNGDGLNDIFRPVPVGIRSTEYFRVFNRYGQVMFETKEWMKGWDGTFKGKKQPSGTYVWAIKGTDKNGRVVEMTGTVILVQ